MTTPTYSVEIDWSADGDFGDTGEDVTARVLARSDIRVQRGRDQIRSLAPPAVASATLELDNASNDYSPEYVSSPLAGLLVPGRPVRLAADWQTGITYNEAGYGYNSPGVPYDGETYPLFLGALDDLAMRPELPAMSIEVTARGTLARLVGRAISTGLYVGITTDVALGHLLDAAGIDADLRSLSTGETVLDWWWVDEQDAFSAALALLYSEGPGASLYEDGRGRIVFEGRNYRSTAPRSASAQVTFYSAGNEPTLSPPIGYNPRLQDIINSCTLTHREVTSYQLDSLVLETSITFSANETKYFVLRSPNNYLMDSATFANMAPYIVSGTIADKGLTRNSGATLEVWITAGAGGLELSGITCSFSAYIISGQVTTITSTVDASASIARYGERPFSLPMREQIDPEVMLDIANAIVSLYKDPRPVVDLHIVGGNDSRRAQILRRQISDRVRVVDEMSKFAGDVFIERVEHRLAYGGRHHEVVFGCEKNLSLTYGVWDTGVWDTALWGF